MSSSDQASKPANRGRGRPRAALSREKIVAVAIEYVDEHGLVALSMRRLGERLGVEAMSLYHYVNGREDLLEGVVDRLVSDIRIDPENAIGPADGWQAYLQALARSVRGLAVAHPLLFPLVATRHPAAPWLRPPLRSLQMVEDFLSAMTSRGMSQERAVEVYKTFTSFLLGHLLLETAQHGAATATREPLDAGDAPLPNLDQQLDVEDYPLVDACRGLLTRNDPVAEFERALEAMLDRVDAEISQ